MCVLKFNMFLTPQTMLHWAYWHFDFISVSLIATLSSALISIFSGDDDLEYVLEADLTAALPSPVGDGILVSLEPGLSTVGKTGDSKSSAALKLPNFGFNFVLAALMELAISLASSDE